MNGIERCIDDEIPFEIPDNWCWSRLETLAYLISGGQYEESKDGVFYIKVADMNLPENLIEITTSSRKVHCDSSQIIPPYSIIFPKRGGAISTNKKRIINRTPVCIDSNTMAMCCYNSNIFNYLKLWFDGVDLGLLSTGTSVPQINNKDINPLLVSLPPLAEQHRIVSAYNSLMSYIEQL